MAVALVLGDPPLSSLHLSLVTGFHPLVDLFHLSQFTKKIGIGPRELLFFFSSHLNYGTFAVENGSLDLLGWKGVGLVWDMSGLMQFYACQILPCSETETTSYRLHLRAIIFIDYVL